MKPRSVTFVSTLITFVIVIAGYCAYLLTQKQASRFMLDVTDSRLLYIPEVAWPLIIGGGLQGLLVVILLLIAHTLAITACALLIGVVVGRYIFPEKQAPKKRAQTDDRLRYDDSNFRITVKAPNSIDPATGQSRKGEVIDTLFDDTQIRIRRSAKKPKREPINALERLELALLQILHAHKDWTCDPAGHHSSVGMLEHSLNVAGRMKENTEHPLARAVGLAHDIGKLLAYEHKDGKWVSKSSRHDRLSGEIVRHLPEFHELEEADRRTLSRVLSFAHSKALPRTLSSESRELISALKIADGLSTADDRQTSHKALETESIQQSVSDLVRQIIPELNINNYMGREHTDGWTVEGVEYVAVLESKLRQLVAERLPHRIAQTLQAYVPVESTNDHPMTKALVNSVQSMGIHMTSIGTGEGKVTAHEGLFDIKAGRQKFVDVILIDKEKLVGPLESDVKRWGSAGYRLRVLKSRRVPKEETAEYT